jgi:glycerophosphoryl diester phosphodiesterase
MRARNLIALGAATLALSLPATATAQAAFDGIHAHRGGPNPNGQGIHPENSLEAFEAASDLNVDVLELDVKLTADNVPVVIHDATLDRTTNCTGQVRHRNSFQLASCRIDTVGGEDLLRPAAPPGVGIPTLAETVEFADAEGIKLNVEIKNYPTDPDYVAGEGFANTILTAIEKTGISKRRVLIQSFLPQNLNPAKARGFPTALLLLQQGSTEAGIKAAQQGGYDVVSPSWPTPGDPKTFVDSAHEAGLDVVPYTINDQGQLERAFGAGVDGAITNDVPLGMRTYYAPRCRTAKAREKRLLRAYKKRRRAYRQARPGTARKRSLRRKTASAKKKYTRAKRSRRATCAKVPA